jgi:hypothetical protein
MRRYHFLAPFSSPQEGPDFTPLHPFDKVEVVQGDKSIYPPQPESTCIVSVECQEHTAIADFENTDPLWASQRAMLLANLEPKMDVAAEALSYEYPFLGVADA